jgi:hypothetical protein
VPNKLTIQNLYKTEGVNIVGVSIDEWHTLTDRYEFLSHSQGHKWMYSLNRVANKDGTYQLTLHAAFGIELKKQLGLNEIKVKRLFYMRVGELVNEHLANVALQMTFISNSIKI